MFCGFLVHRQIGRFIKINETIQISQPSYRYLVSSIEFMAGYRFFKTKDHFRSIHFSTKEQLLEFWIQIFGSTRSDFTPSLDQNKIRSRLYILLLLTFHLKVNLYRRLLISNLLTHVTVYGDLEIINQLYI